MKKIFYLTVALLMMLLFFVSRNFVVSELLKPITAPYREDDTVRTLSIIENNSETSIEDLLEQYQINALQFQYDEEGQMVRIAWAVHDDIYFDQIETLNVPMDAVQFAAFDHPITSDPKAGVHLQLPGNTIFVSWEKLEISDHSVLDIFTPHEGRMRAFQQAIEDDPLIIAEVVNSPEALNMGFFSHLFYESAQFIILPLLLLLSILSLIAYWYQDKRNLAIYLLNGSSKREYLQSQFKQAFKKIIIIGLLVYLLLYGIFVRSSLHTFMKILLPYGLGIIILLFVFALFSYGIVMSFRDVDYLAFVKGYRKKQWTITILGILRVIFVAVLSFKLIMVTIQLSSLREQKALVKEKLPYFENVYLVKLEGQYLETSLALSDELKASLNQLPSFEYFQLISDSEIPIIQVNDQYLKRVKLLDSKDSDDEVMIFTKENMQETLNKRVLSDQAFCEAQQIDCAHAKIVLIDDDVKLTPVLTYDYETFAPTALDHFILLKNEPTSHILDYHFYLEDKADLADVETILTDLYGEEITLLEQSERIQSEISTLNQKMLNTVISGFTYLLGLILLTILTYQFSFAENLRNYAVKWAYGDQLGRHFMPLLLLQVIGSLLVLALVKIRYFAWLFWSPFVVIAVFYILLDMIVLHFTLKRFNTTIVKTLKGV
ncbi:MAG TPA: hypothetical protein VIG45_02305 [Erysipelothrix sp.]